MQHEKKLPRRIGQWAGKALAFIGLTTILMVASGTYVAAKNPAFGDIVAALNNIAAAIREVAIQGDTGPQGPPGDPGPIADIYVRSVPSPNVVGIFGGATVFCDPGDIATGGGASCPATGGCQNGSNGPYVSVAGPVLDAEGLPVGWEFAMGNVTAGAPIERELYVVCTDISSL
jgi:hypothetical protein